MLILKNPKKIFPLMSFMFIVTAASLWAGSVHAQPPGDAGAAQADIWAMKRWSPYIVGFYIGVLSWIAFLISNKPIGVSTAYAKTSGMIESKILGPSVKEREYYRKYVPRIDWEWMLVIGLLAGAFSSAVISGDFRFELIPPVWAEHFGQTGAMRWFTALAGGIIMGIGARWADGCTSGHGLSGSLQLAVSSWIALACFFIGGVITAFIIYS